MRVVTNEPLVEKNKTWATRLFFFSLAVLFGGFFIANGQLLGLNIVDEIGTDLYLLLMPLVLAVGFTTTVISVRMTNLWIRQPRPEEVIKEGLKGISNKSGLYSYHHLPARHVLVCPQGLFVIVTRFQEGQYGVKGSRWRTFRNPISRLLSIFRFDGIGNPTVEAQQAAEYVRFLVEDYDPDLHPQPLIVFTDPRAEIKIEDPDVPVLYADSKKEPSLKSYIKGLDKSPSLGEPDQLDQFIQEFEAVTLDE